MYDKVIQLAEQEWISQKRSLTVTVLKTMRISSYIWFIFLLCLSIAITISLASTTYFALANAQQQNNTSMQPQGTKSVTTTTTNATNVNIVLVHGAWVDGSLWSDVIPILQNAGHKVIAVQLPLHSLVDDVATVKRAIDLLSGPAILVGHSYGGFVITNLVTIILMLLALFTLPPLLQMRASSCRVSSIQQSSFNMEQAGLGQHPESKQRRME